LGNTFTEIMNSQDNFELDIEEPVSIRIEEPVSTKKNAVCSYLQRIFNFDDVPNQKHHRPIFIIIMCILHVFIHLLTYINIGSNGRSFDIPLYHLCMFYVPCMRPTPHDIRIRIVRCKPWMKNVTCHYDDILKNMCFSFMYPHQLWRVITFNLLHMTLLHLLVNLAYQCLYGILLERKYGSACVFVIYWLSDLGASLSFMLIDAEKCK
jgi:membrane associated rhomboid family serine protease